MYQQTRLNVFWHELEYHLSEFFVLMAQVKDHKIVVKI